MRISIRYTNISCYFKINITFNLIKKDFEEMKIDSKEKKKLDLKSYEFHRLKEIIEEKYVKGVILTVDNCTLEISKRNSVFSVEIPNHSKKIM